MNKRFEDGWTYDNEQYQVRLYEDMGGGREPIFVAERRDGKPMSDEQVRGLYADLLDGYDADQPLKPRFWEQAPDGKVTEHSFESFTADVNPVQHDMVPEDYRNAVKAGELDPQFVSTFNHQRADISIQAQVEEVGKPLESFEQRREREWSQMTGPRI